MNGQVERAERRPFFYGWYVLAASFVLLFVNSGAQSLFGLLVKPLQAEFDWSRAAVSSAAFLNLAVYSISILVTGRLYDRWGPKWVITISALLVALGYGLMATMDSLWEFLLYYGVIAAAGFGGTAIPLFGSILGRWFEKRQGMTVSLGLAGASIGQFVLLPLLSDSINLSGWRSTCLWIVGFTLVFNLILALWVIRGDPHKLGVRPYGAADVPRPRTATATQGACETADRGMLQDLSLRQAARTRSLWLFTALMFICGAGDFLVVNHLVAMVTDRGVSEATGASMLAWCGLMGVVGLLAAGPAADAVGIKKPVVVTFVLRVGLFVMLLLQKGTGYFWVYALGMGLTLPVTAPILPILVCKLYGPRHIGYICGFVTTVHMVGAGVWSFLGGVMFDRYQNYDLVLILSAVTSAIAVVCMLLVREERHLPPAARS